MTIEFPQDFINELIAFAQCTSWQDRVQDDDDTVIDDLAGGNVDAAFHGGQFSGKIELARHILTRLNIEW